MRSVAALVPRLRALTSAWVLLALPSAALLAQTSEDVSEVERSVLKKIAQALGMSVDEVDRSLDDVRKAMSTTAPG